MSLFLDLFLTGTAAARPAATGLGEGQFYYATDTGVFSRIVSGAWVTYFTVAAPTPTTWTLVDSWTHSGDVATVEFTGLAGNQELMVIGQGLTKSQARVIQGRVSTDNGSTYLSTSGDYISVDTTGAQGNQTALNLTSTNTTSARAIIFTIAPLALTTIKQVFIPPTPNSYMIPTANDLDAIQILLNGTGNFTAGSIAVYGR